MLDLVVLSPIFIPHQDASFSTLVEFSSHLAFCRAWGQSSFSAKKTFAVKVLPRSLSSTEISCETFPCPITIKMDKYFFYRNMIIISLSFNDSKCYLLITVQVGKILPGFNQLFTWPLTLNWSLIISNQDISVILFQISVEIDLSV